MIWIFVSCVILWALFTIYVIIFGNSSSSRFVKGYFDLIWNAGDSPLVHFVPAMYMGLWTLGLAAYEVETQPLLRLPEFLLLFNRLCYGLPFFTFLRAMFSDPGTITRINHGAMLSSFKYDRVLFTPHKECSTCGFEKPARSKHCSVCKGCIAMHDHHCIWLNNCIGLYNMRFFLLLLLTNALVLMYGFVLCMLALQGPYLQVQSSRHRPGKIGLVRDLFDHGYSTKITCCLMVASFATAALAFAFLIHTLRNLYAGATTNEAEKWALVGEVAHQGNLYMYKFEPQRFNHCVVLELYPNNTYNRSLTPEEAAAVEGIPLVRVKKVTELFNIYDEGFLNNLKVVLFPCRT